MHNEVIVARYAQGTSIAAAMKHYPKSGSTRLKVLEFIIRKGFEGATDQEIEATLHMDGNTVRPSRGLLLKHGFIVNSGLTRENKNGNPCIVWKAVENNGLQLGLL